MTDESINVSIDVDTDQIWQHYKGSLALVLSVNETNYCLKENQSI